VTTIDLNSDLGEGQSPELDEALLGLVSSANVACGGHAGDASSMRLTIDVALRNGVRVGAHPSYPDRESFGRVRISMTAPALEQAIFDQVGALTEVASAAGTVVAYIKPHGALYNDAVADDGPDVIGPLCEVATTLGLPLMTLPGSALERLGTATFIHEGFLDRAYRDDGTLVPRSEPGALVTTPDGVRAQALSLVTRVASLSLHSDTPGAVSLMREARAALTEAGYVIAAR
jgi:UPF0271 protein